MLKTRLVALLLVVCVWPVARAADGMPSPAATVDAFHSALKANHPDAALKLLTLHVFIAEQGFIETDRAAYAQSQVKNDAAFAQATDYKVLNRHLIWLGDNAVCVISQVRTTGSFAGHDINLVGAETALLQKFGSGWLISHFHWSAHPDRSAAAAKGAGR